MSDLKQFIPTQSFTFPEGTVTRFLRGEAESIPASEAELLRAKGLGTVEPEAAVVAASVIAQDSAPAPEPENPSQDG